MHILVSYVLALASAIMAGTAIDPEPVINLPKEAVVGLAVYFGLTSIISAISIHIPGK